MLNFFPSLLYIDINTRYSIIQVIDFQSDHPIEIICIECISYNIPISHHVLTFSLFLHFLQIPFKVKDETSWRKKVKEREVMRCHNIWDTRAETNNPSHPFLVLWKTVMGILPFFLNSANASLQVYTDTDGTHKFFYTQIPWSLQYIFQLKVPFRYNIALNFISFHCDAMHLNAFHPTSTLLYSTKKQAQDRILLLLGLAKTLKFSHKFRLTQTVMRFLLVHRASFPRSVLNHTGYCGMLWSPQLQLGLP